MMSRLPTYPDCKMQRVHPDTAVSVSNEDLGKNYRVLPLYEKEIYENKYRKYYSLNRNELLKCRWQSYVKNIHSREFSPFTFVDIRDYHFYNGDIRHKPSETIYKKNDFRYKLKEGPGVDFRGQIMPIPQDLLMNRSLNTGTKIKKYPKAHFGPKEQKVEEKV